MKQSTTPRLKVTNGQIAWVVISFMLALAWYYSSPALQRGNRNQVRSVWVTRYPQVLISSDVASHSPAASSRKSLEQSLETLRSIKQLSSQQSQQLARLEQRYDLLRRLEDYELRLELKQADPSFDTRSLRLSIENLKVTLHQQEADDRSQ